MLVKPFNNIKVILWDFDRVIIDSMSVRDKGFFEIFKHEGEENIKKFLDFHHENGGLSRYIKIRYFYEKILAVHIKEEEVMRLAEQFSVVMRRLLVNKNLLIRDSVNFIERECNNYKFYIVSGSDGDELRYLCRKLEITHYFLGIEGSPTPKAELINGILEKGRYDAAQCVLIGDSKNDFDAAKKNQIRFYGYNNKSLREIADKYIDAFEKLDLE